jgi:hypothetical protein
LTNSETSAPARVRSSGRKMMFVGARGFEPPAFRSRTERATRLRHAPIFCVQQVARPAGVATRKRLHRRSVGFTVPVVASRRAPVQFLLRNRPADAVGAVQPTPQVCHLATLRAKRAKGRAGRFGRDNSLARGTATCTCHGCQSTTPHVPEQARDVLRLRR